MDVKNYVDFVINIKSLSRIYKKTAFLSRLFLQTRLNMALLDKICKILKADFFISILKFSLFFLIK